MKTKAIAVRLDREMEKALSEGETKTGDNRSEIVREAIAIGLKPAITRRLKEAKRTRDLLAVGK